METSMSKVVAVTNHEEKKIDGNLGSFVKESDNMWNGLPTLQGILGQ